MLIINPYKPFYLDEKNKVLRMGNFTDTGKEIEYENEEFLKFFELLKEPINKKALINEICLITGMKDEEIISIIDYLIEENFIINLEQYENITINNKYNRQNMYFSMISEAPLYLTESMKNKNILVLGLGGVGSNVSYVLSRAGFKNFTLVDFDVVEESNLIRQFPYNIEDIEKPKVEVLEKVLMTENTKIKKLNIKIEHEEDIINEIKVSDIVLCTLDKPYRVIRRLINNLCVKEKKPVIFAGFAEHVAMIGPFIKPGVTACLVCNEMEMDEVPLNNVINAPSYGPLCSMISSIVANEIINYFVKFNKNNLLGKTLMFNMINYETEIISWQKKHKCKVCDVNDSK